MDKNTVIGPLNPQGDRYIKPVKPVYYIKRIFRRVFRLDVGRLDVDMLG